MRNEVKDIIDKIVKYRDAVVVDNDFERAYSVPTDAFEKVNKDDLVEALFIIDAVLSENDIDLNKIYLESE